MGRKDEELFVKKNEEWRNKPKKRRAFAQ